MGLLNNFVQTWTPSYGRWCGPGRTANDSESATEADLPIDAVDCLGWLHDKETRLANKYSFIERAIAWNTANLNWVRRQDKMDEVLDFAIAWWSKRLGSVITIPKKWDDDYLKLYKSGSRRIFRVLSIQTLPFLINQKLLRGAVDESLCGAPPS